MLQHGDDVVNCLKEKQRNVYLNISKAPLSVVPGAIVIYSCYHVIEYKYICMYIVKIRVFEMHALVISFNIHFRYPLQCVVIIAVVALTEPVVGG